MRRPIINPGTLHWSGEHWINYLRVPGSEKNSTMISLYHTRYSAAGEGNVAFVDVACPHRFTAVCSDNMDVARFIQEMISGRGNPFDRALPFFEANIYRDGDIRQAPKWIIETAQHRLEATWEELDQPIITEGHAPTFGPDRDFFTVLFFAQKATVSYNGHYCPGEPYKRDIWAASIGELRSSCVFALAETLTLHPA